MKNKDLKYDAEKDRQMTNAQAWGFAIGMVKMAGLEPTADCREYIEKEKRGEVAMAEIKSYLDQKYKEG